MSYRALRSSHRGLMLLGWGIMGGLVAGPAAEAVEAQSAGGGVMSWAEFRTFERVPEDVRIEWGHAPEQFGELYRPDEPGPHPVVVLLHGGCWLSIADTSYMSHLARALADAGWAVWMPEFRRADMAGGAWPGMLTDVGQGVDHLRVLAPQYGLDLERVVSMGHSSGGHLALWVAGRSQISGEGVAARLRGTDPVRVRAVVGLAAIAGLEDYHARGGGGCGPEAVPTLLGETPADGNGSARLDLADPTARLRATSTGDDAPLPVLLITGTLDPIVPVAHAEAFAAGVGPSVEPLALPDAGHFEVVAPWTDSFAGMWPRLAAFLRTAVGTESPR